MAEGSGLVLFVRRKHTFSILVLDGRLDLILYKEGVGHHLQSLFEALFNLEFVPKKLWSGSEEGAIARASLSEEQLGLLRKICSIIEEADSEGAIEIAKILLDAKRKGTVEEVVDALLVFKELSG